MQSKEEDAYHSGGESKLGNGVEVIKRAPTPRCVELVANVTTLPGHDSQNTSPWLLTIQNSYKPFLWTNDDVPRSLSGWAVHSILRI
jgi:hypothetical protein